MASTPGPQLCRRRCGQKEVWGGNPTAYTVIPESQLTRPDVGGLHSDHDHHRRGDQWHGGDQGRSCGIEQETGVSSSGELFNKGTHQIRGWAETKPKVWSRSRNFGFWIKLSVSVGFGFCRTTENNGITVKTAKKKAERFFFLHLFESENKILPLIQKAEFNILLSLSEINAEKRIFLLSSWLF